MFDFHRHYCRKQLVKVNPRPSLRPQRAYSLGSWHWMMTGDSAVATVFTGQRDD